jgi:hypothetical protein
LRQFAATRTSAWRTQPVQENVQVNLFDLFTVNAILGGDPQRPPLIPQEGPFGGQLVDPAELPSREIHYSTLSA